MGPLVNLLFYSYRFAGEVLASKAFSPIRDEAYDIFERLPPIEVGTPLWNEWRNPKKKKPKALGFDPDAMNRWLEAEFKNKGWEVHPPIVEGTKLAGDYRRSRVQIEVQFGNMARWTYDVFKFQICYAQNAIDVGIVAVPVQSFAKYCGSNVAHYERVLRELPHAKLSITLPIMVVGFDPQL